MAGARMEKKIMEGIPEVIFQLMGEQTKSFFSKFSDIQ